MSGLVTFDVLIAAGESPLLVALEDALTSESVTFLRAPLHSEWSRFVGGLDPFAVLVDLRGAAVTGLEVLRSLRGSTIPILALASDQATFESARELGTVALREPFHEGDAIAVLLDLVATETLLRSRRDALRELWDDPRGVALWGTVSEPSSSASRSPSPRPRSPASRGGPPTPS